MCVKLTSVAWFQIDFSYSFTGILSRGIKWVVKLIRNWNARVLCSCRLGKIVVALCVLGDCWVKCLLVLCVLASAEWSIGRYFVFSWMPEWSVITTSLIWFSKQVWAELTWVVWTRRFLFLLLSQYEVEFSCLSESVGLFINWSDDYLHIARTCELNQVEQWTQTKM